MSLAEVREQAFSPGSEKIHFPKMHEAIWQRFSIERPKGASAIWFLEFQSTRAKDILLAMPTPDGGVEYHQAGENFPDTAREVNFRNIVFRIALPENRPQIVYIRIVSHVQFFTAVKVWHPLAFYDMAVTEMRSIGLISGFFTVIVLINLLLYALFREKIILYFLWYATAYVRTSTIATGSLQWLGFPATKLSPDLLIANSFVTILVLGIYFEYELMRLPTKGANLEARFVKRRYALVSVLGLCLVTSILILINQYDLIAKTLVFGAAALNSMLLPVSIRYLLRSKNLANSFTLLTYNLIRILMLARLFRSLGIIEPSIWTEVRFSSYVVVIFLVATTIGLAWILLDTRHKENRAKLDVENTKVRAAMEAQMNADRLNFFRSLSHELRTPAAVINLTVQNLLFGSAHNGADDFSLKRYERIRRASDRLNDLIDVHMLRLHPAPDNLVFKPSLCDVQELLADITNDLRAADLGQVEIASSHLPNTLRCDDGLACILVRNLVTNARIHGDPGAPINVTIQGMRNHGVRISVHNVGQSIPANELQYIFRPLHRGANGEHKPGTGLGLYLVKRIVDIHQGRIHVHSSNRNGTQFTVFLRQTTAANELPAC
jgi:signal transduction histidine kinase